jgi:hypothetical protein
VKELEIWIFQHRPGSAEVERLLQMNRMDPHIAPNHVSVAEPFLLREEAILKQVF